MQRQLALLHEFDRLQQYSSNVRDTYAYILIGKTCGIVLLEEFCVSLIVMYSKFEVHLVFNIIYIFKFNIKFISY